MVALEKGVRNQKCTAPVGPFRLLVPDPFFGPTPKLSFDEALGWHLLISAVWLTVNAPEFVRAGDRISGQPFATRSEVIARHGMAATSQPLATQIALDILKGGGSAVDAAIAANAALGLMEPTGCGIGGDLFAIVWDAKSRALIGLNASGRSPAGMTIEAVSRRGYEKIPPHGPLPVTVPGCVDGWFELHRRFGQLPMEELLAPAIGYAREGFPVSEVIAEYWKSGAELLRDYPGFRDTFMPRGKAPAKGQLFRNPQLADTLELIASNGRDAFYKGEVAHRIDDLMRQVDGLLTYEDLAGHHSQWVEPVSVDYRGYRVWELPPNGQGIAALQILSILRGFPLDQYGFGSPDHLHLLVEAKKLAFEDRARYYADPDFHKVPIERLISDDYAARRRANISRQRAAATFPPGQPRLEEGDTIYLTVADDQRNMVSLIQSNYRGFGSGLCPPGLGFCLQDRGELFSLDPQHVNALQPRKRPFHTIMPGFVTKDGQPYISFGVMGGAMQPQGHAQIIMNLVDFGMNLQEAGDAPRIRHVGSSQPTGETMSDGGTISLESGFPADSLRRLTEFGHRIVAADGGFGGYQAILYDADNDVYFGASESRKDGQAAGY